MGNVLEMLRASPQSIELRTKFAAEAGLDETQTARLIRGKLVRGCALNEKAYRYIPRELLSRVRDPANFCFMGYGSLNYLSCSKVDEKIAILLAEKWPVSHIRVRGSKLVGVADAF